MKRKKEESVMIISKLIKHLEALKEKHGDLPVLIYCELGMSHISLTIEEIKALVYPSFKEKKEGLTDFWFVALCNDNLINHI